ncbi:D-alanyl-D-alanine dipeptidase (plasmid) [Legionella adelaidensis]|nr:M15 family metallopeptidase [Legionella adelaidensis]VEH85739.1 D-alanyl-D-alanine dipeptidase [Legionella adelaidensis]
MSECIYAVPSTITLIADPKVLGIPIRENNECFVNLTEQAEILIGPSPEIPNNTNYTYLRKTVYEKLKQASNLLPQGMHFCLYEGYRSLELQKMLFDTQYKNTKARHPDWSLDQIFEETTKLVSPVINQDGSKNVPPHSTGAAIDVYLVNDKGEAYDMGIHPKDWMKDKDGELSLTGSSAISETARKNRQLMIKALTEAGFTNYPTEYWHWSYGDRYWAFSNNKPFAIYGSIQAVKCD